MYFDQPYYIEINHARWMVAQSVLSRLIPKPNTCIDVGCGPGWFSDRLLELGFKVIGIDGRRELADEAARRVPQAHFVTLDITSAAAVAALSPADLIFCFGLLYHLENPFAAIRNLHHLTAKYLLIETQIAPASGNDFVLVSEGQNETQGLNFHAVIPSRRALLKMLYVAGFESVYRFTGDVSHCDFNDTPNRLHRREIFLAVKSRRITLSDFVLESVPATPKIDYSI
jgi:SAM-dependent methyltransferase